MDEIWKEIKGYEGLYEVSNCGRVRSLNYNHMGQTRLLKLGKSKKGYLDVFLCKNGKATCKLVHRLVAEAFLENPMNLPQVNHKNEDKMSNFVFVDEAGNVVPEKSNLEWISLKDNINYGTGNERRAKTQSKRVLQFDLDGNLVQEWPSAHEVERQLGWFPTHISKCCLGKRKTFHGFLWRHAEE